MEKESLIIKHRTAIMGIAALWIFLGYYVGFVL